ncbi:MAG: sigma factor, partial [Ilumatobacteraceae bacterium]
RAVRTPRIGTGSTARCERFTRGPRAASQNDYTFSEPRACIPVRTGKGRVEDGGPSAIADVEVSFDACYRQHRVSILAVVMALRGPRVDAEAVVQEAFLRAHARWAEVGRLDHPHWWVQRVALNLATSRLRRLGTEARALARHGAPDANGFTSGFEDTQRFWHWCAGCRRDRPKWSPCTTQAN